jgi:hypothetical protein
LYAKSCDFFFFRSATLAPVARPRTVAGSFSLQVLRSASNDTTPHDTNTTQRDMRNFQLYFARRAQLQYVYHDRRDPPTPLRNRGRLSIGSSDVNVGTQVRYASQRVPTRIWALVDDLCIVCHWRPRSLSAFPTVLSVVFQSLQLVVEMES